jgi:hypothetical protein
MRSRLSVKIGNADGTAESIKVLLGGWFGISCRIFIDHKLVYSGT